MATDFVAKVSTTIDALTIELDGDGKRTAVTLSRSFHACHRDREGGTWGSGRGELPDASEESRHNNVLRTRNPEICAAIARG